MPTPQVEGKWELRWTLTGAESNIKIAPNVQIGDSDVILLDAEIGQITLRTRYQSRRWLTSTTRQRSGAGLSSRSETVMVSMRISPTFGSCFRKFFMLFLLQKLPDVL